MRAHQEQIEARITELRWAGWTRPAAQQLAWSEYQERGRRRSTLVHIIRTAEACAAIRRRAGTPTEGRR